MSLEQNEKNVLELDELNIGLHLNTSLELDGINVTEDLIARTMEAINMQRSKDSDYLYKDANHSKPISLYKKTRFLVKVAAAVLVLVVGLKAVSLFNLSGKKTEGDAKTDSGFMAEYEADNMKNSDTNEASTNDDLDSFNIEFDIKEKEECYDKDAAPRQEVTATIERTIEVLTFTDIVLISQDKADTITIESMGTNEIRTITEKEEILRFYHEMDNYCFMEGTEDLTEPQYNIKLMGEDLATEIVIGLGEVVANHTNKDMSYEIIYSSTDLSMLLEGVRELLENK